MKFLKLSVLVLAAGIFAVSCGGNTQEEPVNETEVISEPLTNPDIETVNPVDTELIDSTAIITE